MLERRIAFNKVLIDKKSTALVEKADHIAPWRQEKYRAELEQMEAENAAYSARIAEL